MTYAEQLKRYRKRREKIAALLKSGMAQADIARKLGVSKQRVGQIVRANGQ